VNEVVEDSAVADPKTPTLSVEAAFGNLVSLARAVQADASAHELIRESLAVVRAALESG
jgi:hypothetical protein